MKYICKVIRSKGQVRTGRDDPCEAPPIIIKNTVKFKTRDDRGRIVQLTRYRNSVDQSDCAAGESCAH